jgi:DNA-binding FadR family transcriptional regulator
MAELVAAELRQKILRGELQPGESLTPESQLIEEYDVSRPTLREALRLLESQELITVRQGSHRGPVVSTPSSDLTARSLSILLQVRRATLSDVYAFRAVFEPVAARQAAANATAADVQALRELLEQESAAWKDAEEFARVAWHFHSELVRLSGNVTMAVGAETLELISRRHAQAAAGQWDDGDRQRERAYRAHAKLVDLIEQRKVDEAERFWAEHMAAAGKRLSGRSEPSSIIELLD